MIEITSSRKNSITVTSPVLFAAGAVGFDGSPYRKLLSMDKFGALVTPPITFAPRQPATGPRVVPLPSGFLMHTGLPNPGINRVVRDYEKKWKRSVLPIIVHLVAEAPHKVEQAVQIIERSQVVAGIELGVHEQTTMRELSTLLEAARQHCDLPIMVQLPLYNAVPLGEVAQYNGADGLVVAAPPRGTARDTQTGRLIGGRLYGPWVKAQTLRVVGRVVQYAEVPVIASGGIHTPDDARDFLTAGAKAVQLDSVVWTQPHMAEMIATDLSGIDATRTTRTYVWQDDEIYSVSIEPPPTLPELPNLEDVTQQADVDAEWKD
ncbi:MAG: nitronate monooxygenase [Anaerolineae bacterium]|nr:nitronate monooxygenase [Anaerolineae bacterium]